MRLLLALTAIPFLTNAQTGASHWYDVIASPYLPHHIPQVDLRNSSRVESLIRAGNLYLSLSDAIALALENNLDIVNERFQPQIASTDIMRAEGGGTLRGISLTVNEVIPGIGGPASPLINAAASGTLATGAVPTSLTELNALLPTTSGISITGASGFSAGPPIPMFDPALTGTLTWQHSSVPELSNFSTGTYTATGNSLAGDLSLQKGFSTGTQVGLDFTASRQTSNSSRNLYNPYTTSALGLSIVQPLLRGFGPAVNRRFIRIAKNNRKTSDLVFRLQVIATVAGVIRLYDDLVSLIQDVHVKEETLALAERLYEDNRVQVEQGTLAPIELTRAQAQVAAARQDLANSRGYELQQELIVKTVLTKRGTADAAVRDAHLVPTDTLDLPAREPTRPVQDTVAAAYQKRPEIEAAHLQIQNSHIGLEGSRNELLPELNVVANAQNAGLAGQINPAATAASGGTTGAGASGGTNVGGLGTGLGQVFSGSYPSYSVGIQLNLPLRNRIAQADYEHDDILVRQWEVQFQQLQNQVRLEVEGAVLALTQARTAYEAAVESRTLQERSLNIELEKYSVGLSTTFLVLQYQSFVAQARSTEVAARGTYAKARAALERATGEILENHNVTVDEAYRGRAPGR